MDDRLFDDLTRRLRSTRSRRRVLGGAVQGAVGGLGVVAVLGSAAGRWATAHAAPRAGETADVLVRRNVHELDPGGPEIESLRKAVAAMQGRPDSDPTSWTYQANMHGTRDERALPGWNSCQHGSWFFLPWHRMYLYWFERILRKAAADPALALPYWDYSVPEHRLMPEPFRTPAGAANPLHLADRDPHLNDGEHFSTVNAPALDHFWWFGIVTNFFHSVADDVSFGGLRVTEPIPSPPPPGGGPPNWDGPGILEGQPHGTVHVAVGGRIPDPTVPPGRPPYRPGLMGSTLTAARDPIFWLHHANIDRLWNRWLEQDGVAGNPTDDPEWTDQVFKFFNEDGRPVEMAVHDVLDTVGQLKYRYDDDPLPPGPGTAVAGVATPSVFGLASPAAGVPDSDQPREVVGRAGAGVELGPDPVEVLVDVRDAGLGARVAATPAAGTAEPRIVLSVEGIRGEGVPGVAVEVYLNLPPGEAPDYRSDHFVGVISLFGLQPQDAGADGHEHGSADQSFDITRNVRALEQRGDWRGQIDVTFVPRDLVADPGGAATPGATPGAGESPPGPWVSIEAVTVTIG